MCSTHKNFIANILVLVIFLIFLFVPIANLMTNINLDILVEVVKSKQFFSATKNSLFTSIISSVISIILALVAAFCIERTNIKHKKLFSFIFIIPMLIPSISHSFGLVAIFGANGIFTKIFNMNIGIYGFKGIIIGSIMYSFPVAYIMFQNVLMFESGEQYKACQVFGISPFHQFIDITLPYISRTIILAFFSVFTMVITDYGVPLLIGAKEITLPVLMYNKTVAMIDYNYGAAISIFLIFPAILAFVMDLVLRKQKNLKFVTEKLIINRNRKRDILAYTFCSVILLCVLMPIISFLIMVFETTYPIDATFTLNHIIKTIDRGAFRYLLNSILVAILVSIVGTVFSSICAYLTTRVEGKINRAVHMCSILSMAIPGIIIGFSYIITFKTSIIYGTVIILVVVNIFHFISSPYLMMYNSLNKVNANLELVGKTLGVSRFNIIKDVIIPKVKWTIIDMFSYFFVNSMMTISAVAFLCPPAPKPISLMINQFEAQLLMESAAFVSLLILIVNIVVKLLCDVIHNKKI